MRIAREAYLNRLIKRRDNGLAKVITGIRRCGKSYLLLTGSVSAVTAAIERAESEASDRGMLLDSSVIPRPDAKLWQSIL